MRFNFSVAETAGLIFIKRKATIKFQVTAILIVHVPQSKTQYKVTLVFKHFLPHNISYMYKWQ
jgi:hypothetical protein